MNRTAQLLAILLAVVLVSGGIYAAYNTGLTDGAVSAVAAGDNGTSTVGVPTGHVGRPYGWHGGFGFFPFFPLLFLFLIFGVFRPWRWGGPGRGYGGHGWGPPRDVIDQRLAEWHKQAHGEKTDEAPKAE